MNLTQYLEQVRARLEGHAKGGDITTLARVWNHAPTDLAKLLRIIEVQREALEKISYFNGTVTRELSERALKAADAIAAGEVRGAD